MWKRLCSQWSWSFPGKRHRLCAFAQIVFGLTSVGEKGDLLAVVGFVHSLLQYSFGILPLILRRNEKSLERGFVFEFTAVMVVKTALWAWAEQDHFVGDQFGAEKLIAIGLLPAPRAKLAFDVDSAPFL